MNVYLIVDGWMGGGDRGVDGDILYAFLDKEQAERNLTKLGERCRCIKTIPLSSDNDVDEFIENKKKEDCRILFYDVMEQLTLKNSGWLLVILDILLMRTSFCLMKQNRKGDRD